MKSFEIEVHERSDRGGAAINRLRKQGFVPAVFYHRHEETVSGMVSEKEFLTLGKKANKTQIFSFKSKTGLSGRSAIVRDIQKRYLTGKVLHVDFQLLRDDEEITVDVQLKLVGESPGVKTDGGILSIAKKDLAVSCLPKFIPEVVEVDISKLKIGDSVHASDIKLPDGVKLAVDGGMTILSVVIQKALEVEAATTAAATAEGATPAEGVAAGAEGAAAPAGDKKDAKGAAPAAKAPAGKDAKK